MGGPGPDNTSGDQSPGVEFLFRNTTDCIVEGRVENGEPIVNRVNAAFEDVFGYTNSELRGENLNDFITPDGKRDDVEAVDTAIRDGDIGPREVIRQTADGAREFLLRATGGQGELSYAIYTDITERKERERQVQQERDRLDEFVRVVSHDLRNPLNVATARLSLVRQDCESDHIEPIDRSLTRMDELIDDLSTLARQGNAVSELEEADLASLAQLCWGSVATMDARLQVECDRTIRADRSRVQQLFENLFRNAVEHGGEEITVTVGDVEDGFYIEDTGSGVPEAEREGIFEAGYSTSEQGTGFGLSIVKQIVDAHGWDINLTEGADGGARFEITGAE